MKVSPTVPVLFAAASVALSAGVKDSLGQPILTVSKEILRTGDWKHPASGEAFSFDDADLNHFVAQFAKMKDAGVKVPVPADHTRNPKENRGWVTGMSVKGDRLVATIDLIGADAIELAARNDVSVKIANISDSKGGEFEKAIEHVALVSDPVITKLSPFAIELSRANALLSLGDSSMEFLKTLAAKYKVNIDGMDQPTAEKAILAAIDAEEGAEPPEMAATKAELSKAQDQIKALQLSANAPVIDVDTLEARAETVGMKLSKLVENEQITPAMGKALALSLTGLKGKRPALMLSHKAATHAGIENPLADTLIGILSELPSPKKGETVNLSRKTEPTGSEFDAKALEAEVKKYVG